MCKILRYVYHTLKSQMFLMLHNVLKHNEKMKTIIKIKATNVTEGGRFTVLCPK